MLVVVSDLHFQDTLHDRVQFRAADGRTRVLDARRNVSPEAFKAFVAARIREANALKAAELRIVFAGDLLDFQRSMLWYARDHVNTRPYDLNTPAMPDGSEQAAAVERAATEILEGIRLSNVDLLGVPGSPSFFETLGKTRRVGEAALADRCPLYIDYIPGNSDRLVLHFAGLRARVRGMLAMGGAPLLPLPTTRLYDGASKERPPYGCIVRHGHEYDGHAFGVDVDLSSPPQPRDYGAASLSDFVAIDVLTGIAARFRFYEGAALDGPEGDATSESLRALYRGLRLVDDVRPVAALLPYLEKEVAAGQEASWRRLERPLREAIDAAIGHPFVVRCLDRLNLPGPDKMDLVRFGFTRVFVRLATRWVPGPSMRGLMRMLASGNTDLTASDFAAHEPALDPDRGIAYVITGHGHTPGIDYLGRKDRRGRPALHINAGTFRRRFHPSRDGAFAAVDTVSWVRVLTEEEAGRTGQPRVLLVSEARG
jgi:hypothetical protein